LPTFTYLIEQGADVSLTDELHSSPFHIFYYLPKDVGREMFRSFFKQLSPQTNADIIKAVGKPNVLGIYIHIEEINKEISRYDIPSADCFGNTREHALAMYEHSSWSHSFHPLWYEEEVAKFLKNENLNHKGQTPSHIFIQRQQSIGWKVHIDTFKAEIQDRCGRNVHHMVMKNDASGLRSSFDPELVSSYSSGNQEWIKEFFRKVINASSKDNFNRVPWHYLAMNSSVLNENEFKCF
jgi:hypothetical protein